MEDPQNEILYKIKIAGITDPVGGFAFVTPASGEDIQDIITVTEEFVITNSPQVGGYLVMYPKGICGYSSAT